MSKKKIIVIMSSVVAVIALGVGGFFAYRYFNKPVIEEKFDYQFTKENYPRVDCATAMYPLATEITKDLLDVDDAEAKNIARCSKTNKAYKNLIDKEVDIIFLSAPSQEVLDLAQEKGVEFEYIPIGRDAFVFINNKNNKVDTLSQTQLRDIYSGKFTNWSQVGGANNEIAAYQRPITSGSQTLMRKFMGDVKLKEPVENEVQPEMGDLITAVANYDNSENSIGYSVYYYANEMIANPDVKFIKVDGVEPTKETITSNQYPITKDVLAVIRKDEPQDSPARKMIEYLLTAEGQDTVEKGGYVKIK